MKTIKLQPTQFYLFKQKANDFRIWFDCTIKKGIYYVTAEQISFDKIGYGEY